jgi:hypothetical protein
MICKLWHRWFWWVYYPVMVIMKNGVLVIIKPEDAINCNQNIYCVYDFGRLRMKKNYCTKCKREV